MNQSEHLCCFRIVLKAPCKILQWMNWQGLERSGDPGPSNSYRLRHHVFLSNKLLLWFSVHIMIKYLQCKPPSDTAVMNYCYINKTDWTDGEKLCWSFLLDISCLNFQTFNWDESVFVESGFALFVLHHGETLRCGSGRSFSVCWTVGFKAVQCSHDRWSIIPDVQLWELCGLLSRNSGNFLDIFLNKVR